VTSSISRSNEIEVFEHDTSIHSPEMPYFTNEFLVQHLASGITIRFNARDALIACQNIYNQQEAIRNSAAVENGSEKAVGSDANGNANADADAGSAADLKKATTGIPQSLPIPSPLKVTSSSSWSADKLKSTIQEQSPHTTFELKPIHLPYDWTYTTDYMGSVYKEDSDTQQRQTVPIQPTLQHINIQLLQQPDPILWYTSLELYEDELHDNGVSTLTVKARVMDRCWLVLVQFFLRVDNVIVRLYETRYYYETGKSSIVRDHIRYESTWDDLPKHRLPTNAALLKEPHLISRKIKPQCHIAEQINLL
jgi:hypothetical protein